MAKNKLNPSVDQVIAAGSKSRGVNEKLVKAVTKQLPRPTTAELLKHHKRVNQNLMLEKLASESPDFDD